MKKTKQRVNLVGFFYDGHKMSSIYIGRSVTESRDVFVCGEYEIVGKLTQIRNRPIANTK